KPAILSQVGQVYFGGWVSFTSALTPIRPSIIFHLAHAHGSTPRTNTHTRNNTTQALSETVRRGAFNLSNGVG
ncbi:hypothetical protein, partial [Ralstonia solanacearum]|uniref:hypothetical protein n=1 Tax=Ralstonia solanacearum TaxID=305 RepID=UPI001E578424